MRLACEMAEKDATATVAAAAAAAPSCRSPCPFLIQGTAEKGGARKPAGLCDATQRSPLACRWRRMCPFCLVLPICSILRKIRWVG